MKSVWRALWPNLREWLKIGWHTATALIKPLVIVGLCQLGRAHQLEPDPCATADPHSWCEACGWCPACGRLRPDLVGVDCDGVARSGAAVLP